MVLEWLVILIGCKIKRINDLKNFIKNLKKPKNLLV